MAVLPPLLHITAPLERHTQLSGTTFTVLFPSRANGHLGCDRQVLKTQTSPSPVLISAEVIQLPGSSVSLSIIRNMCLGIMGVFTQTSS